MKIVELYKKGDAFLRERLLKDTFDVIESMLNELQSSDLRGRLEQHQTTYRFMLKYTVAGVKDPEREKIYLDLITSTYRLLDETTQSMLTKYATGLPYATKRSFGSPKLEVIALQFDSLMANYDKLELVGLVDEFPSSGLMDESHLAELTFAFNYFWISDYYTDTVRKHFNSLMQRENAPYFEKCLMVSAVTLSLMRCFDPEKFKALFDIYNHKDDEIRQRAIFGILITLYIYDSRLAFYPELVHRLELMSEDSRFVKSVEKIVIQLIRSKETEKITRRMQEEILPEMVKMNPYIMDKLNLDNLLKEDMTEDKNPDWKHIFEDVPGLTNKLEEFSDLQMEGADVFMSTFAMLKSFPFFNRLINWTSRFQLVILK